MSDSSYLKLHGKERSQKKDLRSYLGIKLGTSRTEGHALTNCANPSSWGQADRNYETILVGEPDIKTMGPFILV